MKTLKAAGIALLVIVGIIVVLLAFGGVSAALCHLLVAKGVGEDVAKEAADGIAILLYVFVMSFVMIRLVLE